MGQGHPTGERIVRYVKDGHNNLAETALRESIEGLVTLIELDEDEDEREAPDETVDEDKADLDKYRMLLKAILDIERKD
jgi:hypothetical protein